MVLGKFEPMAFLKNVANYLPFRDAFAGGFCAGVVEGKSLAECVDMGQWLARLSLQQLGPS